MAASPHRGAGDAQQFGNQRAQACSGSRSAGKAQPTHSLLAPRCLQTKESKSFWKAMMKVHEKLTDINQIKAHNQIKETKLKVGQAGEAGQEAQTLRPAAKGWLQEGLVTCCLLASTGSNPTPQPLPCPPLRRLSPPTCSSPG